MLVDCAVISSNNSLNYTGSVCVQSVLSAFRFNTRTKTRAPLPDCLCLINNALIQFVPNCHNTPMHFVDVLDPPFSDIASSIISCLFVGIFMPKNNIVTKFCHLALGEGRLSLSTVGANAPRTIWWGNFIKSLTNFSIQKSI